MRCLRWGTSGVLGGLLLLFAGGCDIGWGAEVVTVGQPAQVTGAVIAVEKVPALVEELREARRAAERIQALVETVTAQEAQIKTLLEQVVALETANARLDAAVKLAEEIESLRQKQRDLAQTVFDRYDKALRVADAALERAEARINSLEQRAFWSQVLSVVGPLALLLLLAL